MAGLGRLHSMASGSFRDAKLERPVSGAELRRLLVASRPIVVVELRAKPSFHVEQSGRPKRTFDVALEYKVRPQFCSIVCFVLGNGGVPEYEGINNLMLF